MARRPLVAGNWKMHKAPAEADELARELKQRLAAGRHRAEVAVLPPSISLATVAARLRHTGIEVGSQNHHPEPQGAFTGEISAEMVRSVGAAYALVGHSERRQLFGEDDALVHRKLLAALRAGLVPIVCFGETLPEREAGLLEQVVSRQVTGAIGGLPPDQVASLVLAYEPVWAIGTGRTASPAQAQAVHAFVRRLLAERHPPFVARQVRILYGGSVKPANAAALFGQPDIDGGLVGGASLAAESFAAIVEAA